MPAYYHQWAAKIQDMSPARQADVLDQLGEDDRMIVQRILDHNAVQRSSDSAMSGLSQHRGRAQPASPTASDSSSPPPYSTVAGSRAGKPVSRQNSRPASPQEERRTPAQTDRDGRSPGGAVSSSRGRNGQQGKAKSAADMGIFDFDSQSSSELEQRPFESQMAGSQAAEPQMAEAKSAKAAPHAEGTQSQQQPQRQQQQQQQGDCLPGLRSLLPCFAHAGRSLSGLGALPCILQVFNMCQCKVYASTDICKCWCWLCLCLFLLSEQPQCGSLVALLHAHNLTASVCRTGAEATHPDIDA